MLHITAIPALRDNYIWALWRGGHAVVVDPGDAKPVLDWLAVNGCQLTAILVTHHHPDHTAGIPALVKAFAVPVIGPAQESQPIPHLTQRLANGDSTELPGLGLRATAMTVPGHTLGATALQVGEHVFTGDTLFSAGCGRLFEGTADVMHDSLQRLAALPKTTHIYCGHEYTLSNLAFAQAVEPHNPHITVRAEWAREQRRQGRSTLPSTLADELRFNPFLRCGEKEVIAAAERWSQSTLSDTKAVFAALRRWKDEFNVPVTR